MPVKKVYSPYHGREVRFGCKPASKSPEHMFREYLRAEALPTPPTELDLRPLALAELSQMNGNDTEGDCVQAAYYHGIGVWTGNADAGIPFVASTQQVLADYSAQTGYVPGDESTDNGTDPVQALQWWAANPAADGSVLAGSLGFDASNVGDGGTGQITLMQAIDLFEGGWLTFALPDAWTNPMPSASGFLWDVAGAPDPNQGHCVAIVGYNAQGVIIATWAMTGIVTWAAVAMYCTASAGGMVYLLLSPDVIGPISEYAANNLNWAQLLADFPQLGGTVITQPPIPGPGPTPIPGPTPGPTPIPVPPDPLTTADVQIFALTQMVVVAPGIRFQVNHKLRSVVYSPEAKLVEAPRGWIQG